jgi:hypothetical protein
MSRGAKKGDNRFKQTQIELTNSRIKRLKNVVAPKMKSMCESVYFPNKTSYQKMSANMFNENIPLNMQKITHRTIATNPEYWIILGTIYHTFFDSKNATSLAEMKKKALNKMEAQEDITETKKQIKNILIENNALKTFIAKSNLKQNQFPESNTQHTNETINNLIATIDFLIKASDGVVEVDRNIRSITNLTDDLNGVLSSKISNTYFNILEGVMGETKEIKLK